MRTSRAGTRFSCITYLAAYSDDYDRTTQPACHSLPTLYLPIPVGVQDLRGVNEKDREQRQNAEHSAHIAEARAAEAEAQLEAAAARAVAARIGSRDAEKEELLRDFADQVCSILGTTSRYPLYSHH